MRVQFSVNDAEWEALDTKAKKEGYPDISTYCKDIALGTRSYGKMWQIVVDKISNMEKNTVFALRDLIETPPANLGVKLYNNQDVLGIQVQKKDSSKVNLFKKI